LSPWKKLLEHPHAGGHFVQLYEADENALAENAALYLWEGLRRGEGVLTVVTPEHRILFSKHLAGLGGDIEELTALRQLMFLDARKTMDQFMVGGQPDWRKFEKTVRGAMREVQGAAPQQSRGGLRAYGEMVGLLWKQRQFAAAMRLQQLWNKLLEQASFSLFCAYAIDIFDKDFDVAKLDGVLCAHSHLVPAQTNGTLEAALNRSMDEILGEKADGLRVLIKTNYRPSWAVIPTAESIVLWLRKNLPEQADAICSRARQHYQTLSRTAVPEAA